MRRLDIGVASYGNPDGLQRLIDSVRRHSRTDWRMRVVVNPHPSPAENVRVFQVLSREFERDERVVPTYNGENVGYVGAVNQIFKLAQTEYVAYLDHDVTILSDGWDELMAHALDRFHELGMVFPNGARRVDRGEYAEILWGVGCCWMLPMRVQQDVGEFDPTLGHHEEVDYQIRVRLQGLKIACVPNIGIHHEAKASNDPAAAKRISDGVIKWMNKWTAYFGGKQLNYFSPNVLRHEDWPTSQLHSEEYFKRHLPGLNDNPEVIMIEGVEYDLIRVPRYKGFYRGRVI